MKYWFVMVTAAAGICAVVLAMVQARRSGDPDERTPEIERRIFWLMLAGAFALVAALFATAWAG